MIRKYQNNVGFLMRALDALLAGAVWWISFPIRFDFLQPFWFQAVPDRAQYDSLIPLLIAFWALGLPFWGTYKWDHVMRSAEEIYLFFRGHLLTLLCFTTLTYFFSEYRFSRGVLLVFGASYFITAILFRFVIRFALERWHHDPKNRASMIGVGDLPAVQEFVQVFQSLPRFGVRPLKTTTEWTVDQVLSQVRQGHVQLVVLGFRADRNAELMAMLNALREEPVTVQVIPDFASYRALGAKVDQFQSHPVITLNESPLYGWGALMKRVMDFTLSLMGLILLSPLFLILAAFIKASSKGPVFYGQERMSLDGTTFRMWKFRSMKVDAETQTGAVWAKPNDDRRTAVGAFLRSTSIDELPQLWNVLVGEMSLVGPRPERPVFVQQFKQEIPNYMLRHRVKTGITGWAQVNGWRGDTSLERRIDCDLFYIRNWSLWLDVKILFLTVFKGFVNKNAY